MKLTTEKIRAYFDSRRIDLSKIGAESILEFIYQYYSEFHTIDSEQLRESLSDMRLFSESLSIEDADRLFNLVANICIECERAAFLEGMHVGVQLMEELGK